MIHKSLKQLAKRIKSAKSNEDLRKIEKDCQWHNCAVGTKLRELGINLQDATTADLLVDSAILPEIVEAGKQFNQNLVYGHKEPALNFIKELQGKSIFQILKV